MSVIRIIGVGNDFRSDDAAGLLVVRRLAELGCNAQLHESDGEGGAVIELMRGCDRVIFIDATSGGREPGSITEFDVAASPLPIVSVAETGHAFAVAQAIEMARTLGSLPAECTFIGIEGAVFSHGTDVSFAVRAAVEEVSQRVLALLERSKVAS